MIDRDGTLFATVLNFLRNGAIAFPEEESKFAEIKREAEYFGLEEMQNYLNERSIKQYRKIGIINGFFELQTRMLQEKVW